MRIGVLALQGDVAEHRRALRDLGVDVVEVRIPSDLSGLAGIVLPGGESTTMAMLLESSGLRRPLATALAGGLPALGTCAGLILLSSSIVDGRPDQEPFGTVDIVVRRNGYGRQAQSFECDLHVEGLTGAPVHAVFIRAPVVEEAGPGVEVLAWVDRAEPVGGGPALGPTPAVCRQGAVLVSTFHPELTDDRRLHRLFVAMAQQQGHCTPDHGLGRAGVTAVVGVRGPST